MDGRSLDLSVCGRLVPRLWSAKETIRTAAAGSGGGRRARHNASERPTKRRRQGHARGSRYGLSQVGVLLKWLDGSSWFLARRLLSTSPTLCFKEIEVPTKRVLPSGTFS